MPKTIEKYVLYDSSTQLFLTVSRGRDYACILVEDLYEADDAAFMFPYESINCLEKIINNQCLSGELFGKITVALNVIGVEHIWVIPVNYIGKKLVDIDFAKCIKF